MSLRRRLTATRCSTGLHRYGGATNTRDAIWPLEDFVPLFAGISASNALYVRGDSPINTFEEFIEAARAETFKMGVNGLAAPPNLSAVQLADQFDLEFTTIALKTVPGSLNGLIAGEVDVAVGQVASLNGFGDAIKPLIILDNNRKPFYEADLPGVRTVGEAFQKLAHGSTVVCRQGRHARRCDPGIV